MESSSKRHEVFNKLALSNPMDSEALQWTSECDGCATGNGAQHPTTVPQGLPGIVTVWVALAPLRCIVRIDAIRL